MYLRGEGTWDQFHAAEVHNGGGGVGGIQKPEVDGREIFEF
jgi:hypothetical protein